MIFPQNGLKIVKNQCIDFQIPHSGETGAGCDDCVGVVNTLELILGVELIIVLVVDVAGMLVGLTVGATILPF